ncbi:glycoside hydrolase family 114 protein [Sporormia fimetaria CBS 119925]|uniref:alpha-galactosidase n=1 Tax=Sporormia fimetaria CBS 119925 TaxID=1340428 RepID=A0A6A6VLS6_9PLEO|nr:glycoside hydrolase family 114 protein [Sporormia fimetaria CBS 119925]
MAALDAGLAGRESQKRKAILFSIGLILIIALALGLGLGLTVGRKSDDDDKDEPPAPSPTASPPPRAKWKPAVGDKWYIMLQADLGIITTEDVKVIDLDLFDRSEEWINGLHKNGKKVICYFSAGSYEPWRPDAGDFKDEDIGAVMDGWPDEKWLRIGSKNVRKIMAKRIELAHQKGCDAVDPDNVDGFQNENGLGLTAEDSVAFVKFLSATAASYNLSIGLKNAGDIIPDVLDFVDFSVNEECVEYAECETFQAFIKAGKPVFHIEYPVIENTTEVGWSTTTVQKYCSHEGNAKGSEGFSTVLTTMELDGSIQYCD